MKVRDRELVIGFVRIVRIINASGGRNVKRNALR
jgi:hypothetical protein